MVNGLTLLLSLLIAPGAAEWLARKSCAASFPQRLPASSLALASNRSANTILLPLAKHLWKHGRSKVELCS
jgi:hypothetical protein